MAPFKTCISVDLPAPLWPTTPTHSPALSEKSAPSRARTAPYDFSTPMKSTRETPASSMGCVCWLARAFASVGLLHIRLDRGDGVGLGVFVAGDAALRNVRQFLLEVILGEGEVRHDHVMRDLLAVEDLLRHPEGERRDAGRDRGGPGGVAVLVLLLLPPLKFVLAIA